MCKGTQTSQTVNTPPQNVLDQYDKVVGGANNIVANNPNGLPIAGFNDAQNLALNSFGNSTNTLAEAGGTGYDVANAGHVLSRMNLGAAGTYEPYFGQATGNLGQAGQYFGQAANGVGFNPVSGSDIAQYQDPFTQQVINATTANIDRSNAIQQQGVISDAIKSGNAFGGDRMGVAQAELGRNQDLAKNQTIAGLQSQGYSQALQEANNQQQLKTATGEFNTNAANQAGAGFANLAGQYGNLGSAAQSNVLGAYAGATGALNASTNAGNLLNSTALAGLQNNLGLLGAGTQLQQTTQQQMQAPYGQYGWLGQLSGFMNPGGGTSTTTGPAPFFSDKRLKEGVKVIGKTFDGMNVVSFRYKGDPSTRIGFIAQDVQKKHPDAVSSHGGVLAVDYDKASAGAAKRGHFAGGGGVGDPQNNLFPGLDLSGASPGLSPGIKMPMPGAPAAKPDDGLGKAVTNKALDFGMNKAGAQLDKGFGSLKSGLGLGSPPAAMPDMGSFGTAIMNDPGAAGLASGSGLAGSAADAGAAAAGMAAPVAADAAAEAGAAAAGSSIADILPFLLLKRGGRVERPTRSLGDAPRIRRAMGGRLHYDDGGAVDEYAGMNPTFRDRLMLTQADLQDRGIDAKVISGFRDGDKQDALYAQGRTAPGPIVTTAPAGHSMHNFGAAADLSPYDPSQKQAMYDAVSELAPENNLKWGGTFRNFYDPAHIQLPGTASQFAGRAPRGPADLGTASAYADAGSGDLGAAGRAIGDAAPSGSLGDAPAASNDNGGSLGSSIGDFISQPGMGKALLAGLFGMLGSKSHTLAGAIGDGGMSGLNQFQTAQTLDRQNQLTNAQIQHFGSMDRNHAGELAIKRLILDRQMKAAQAAADALRDPASNAPSPGPVPLPAAPADPPPAGNPDGTASGVADVAPRPAPPRVPRSQSPYYGTMEPGPSPQLPAANSDFWSGVHPQSNPALLDAQADRFQKAGTAASLSDPAQAKTFFDQAGAIRKQASAIRQSGVVTLKDGSTAMAPGFAEAKSGLAGAEATARANAENAAKPSVLPSGEKYIAPPGAAQPAPQAAASGGLQRLAIDPKTAAVTTAIPAAPPGGGYPTPTLPPGSKMVELGEGAKELAKNDANFTKDFLEKAPKTDQAIERLKAMSQAFKLIQSGSTTDRLSGWAALLQSYGYNDRAQKVLGGDPAAVQWIDKNGVNLVLETLSAAQPRFAQSEFNKLSEKGVPSPENLPQANHQMIVENLGMMERNKSFMEDWDKARQQGWSSPSAFWTEWSKANPLNDFQKSAQRQIGNFKGMDLPPSQEWTAGSLYVAPPKMKPEQADFLAKRGIKPGQLFRFNGRDAEQPLVPIDPSQNYSAHLGGQ